MSLKSCKSCGRIVDRRHICPNRPKNKYNRTDAEQGRYTYAWQKKAKEIKERSLFMCAVCRDMGIVSCEQLEVHHIIPLVEQPDLLLEDDNLICLDEQHHQQAERGEISREYLFKLAKERDKNYTTYPPVGQR
jgi:5-methylcytosine-specific restriction endonuclease McrA